MKRVAVIGSGIAGLTAARRLSVEAPVTLFESAKRFGGHSHTVDVVIDGVRHGVDTGFLVFNDRTYPGLIRLFAELGVATAASDMSFSVRRRGDGLEWSGRTLDAVFAQRRNLVRPAFWRMLGDIARFNRLTTAMAQPQAATGLAALDQPIGEFLDQHRFSASFRDGYFLPMVGCIWSCPTRQMLSFPMATMIRFCHNHGLLQVTDRPQWRTVVGGSRNYVERMLAAIDDRRLGVPVRRLRRVPEGVEVTTEHGGSETFSAVVVACHSDQALALLADPTPDERAVLGAIGYQRNRAVLHTDRDLLPRRRRAWAAWNYESTAASDHEGRPVCLHYLINHLQPLPFETPVLVSLNPLTEPDPRCVQGEFDYAHPVFDRAALAAQARLPALQGRGGIWYGGAWTGYGFHEDGLTSGLAAAEGVLAAWAARGHDADRTLEAA